MSANLPPPAAKKRFKNQANYFHTFKRVEIIAGVIHKPAKPMSQCEQGITAYTAVYCCLKYGLKYGKNSRTICRMKTTIDLDERRLSAVMKLTGLRTRKAAVNYALCAAERQAIEA